MKIIVTTCSGREHHVKRLQNEIPDLIVNFDDFKDSGKLKSTAYYNYQRSWEIAGNEATIQMDDDIELCDNFLIRANEIISKYPDSVIQFFSLRPKDLIEGSRWENGGNFMMQQCYYLPKGMAKKILDYSHEYLKITEHTHCPTDICMQEYFKKNPLKYYIAIPNLVNHLPIVSKIDSKRRSNRQSKTFVK